MTTDSAARARSEAEGILVVFRVLSDTALVVENESGGSTQMSTGISCIFLAESAELARYILLRFHDDLLQNTSFVKFSAMPRFPIHFYGHIIFCGWILGCDPLDADSASSSTTFDECATGQIHCRCDEFTPCAPGLTCINDQCRPFGDATTSDSESSTSATATSSATATGNPTGTSTAGTTGENESDSSSTNGTTIGSTTGPTTDSTTDSTSNDDTNSEDTGSDSSETGSDLCGNGIIDLGESCDTNDFNGMTCVSLGHDGGQLICTDFCEIDTSSCTDCGDGVAEGQEPCDGLDIKGETCVSKGYPGGGTLACTLDCQFDTGNCFDVQCGNGVIDSPEQCDCGNTAGNCRPEQLNNQTCKTLHIPDTNNFFTGGELSCLSPNNCEFDLRDCFYCGDNKINPGEICDKNSISCANVPNTNFHATQLAECSPTCGSWDTSRCEFCGDAQINGPEECDDGNANNNDACRNDCTWQCTSNSECNDGKACTTDICKNHVCQSSPTDADKDGFNICPGSQQDCCDQDSKAFPGQTKYFSAPNKCGSFDYNCDGKKHQQWPDLIPGNGEYKCFYIPQDLSCESFGSQWRWASTVPGCGDSASAWICDAPPKACQRSASRTQPCR